MEFRLPAKTGISFLSALFLLSCVADDFRTLKKNPWEPELAFPLTDSHFDVKRVFSKAFEDGTLITGSDGLITMVYSGELFHVKADQLIEFQDFSIDLAVAQGELPFIGQGGMLLKNLDVDRGILQIHIEDKLNQDARVEINMPRTTKNGIPFSEQFTVKYKGATNTVFDTIYLLNGYHFDLTGPDGQQSNSININYTAEGLKDGLPIQLDVFNATFKDLSFNFLDGYLGKLNLGSYNDSMQISIWENFKSGSIILEDPRINFTIDNSFGLPVKLTINNFTGSGVGGSSNLGGDAVDNGIDVGAPTDTTSPVITTEEINSGNSNLTNFLSITPLSINYKLELEANSENDTTAYNFVSSTSELIGNLDLELPLKGRLDSVVFENTFDLDLGDASKVDLAIFKLYTENFFPLGIYMQVYFLNESGQVFDSLLLDNSTIFKQAVTDDKGFSKLPSVDENYFALGAERFPFVREFGKFMKVRAMLLTDASSTKSVKIRDDNYLDVKIGVILKYRDDI